MRYSKLALIGWLVVAAAPLAQAQNLVTNGDFETGDFTGWTLAGGGAPEVDFGAGIGGSYAASLGAIPPDQNVLNQTLTTQIGQTYTLNFYAQTPEFNVQPGSPNSLSVYFGGNLVSGPITVPDDANYQQYTYTVTAASDTSQLSFVVTNDSDFTQLDNISVAAVTPAPDALLTAALGAIPGAGLLLRRRRAAQK